MLPEDGLYSRIRHSGRLFMHVHGGGPAIVRDELDMYSKDAFAPLHGTFPFFCYGM